METIKRKVYPVSQIADRLGSVIGQQISNSGGLVNLTTGLLDPEGVYLAVSPTGTEGLLKVVPINGDFANPVVLPFFKGFNPILVKKVVVDVGNTATEVYWGK